MLTGLVLLVQLAAGSNLGDGRNELRHDAARLGPLWLGIGRRQKGSALGALVFVLVASECGGSRECSANQHVAHFHGLLATSRLQDVIVALAQSVERAIVVVVV